jgi:hypothetical protein
LKSTQSQRCRRSSQRGLSAVLATGLAVLSACLLAAPAGAVAQVADTAATSRRDSLATPPYSPAAVFVGSFLVPGLSQSVLRRPTSMVIFTAVEVTGVTMLLRSLGDLRRAKRYAGLLDSVPASYLYDQTTGLVRRDPETNQPLVAAIEENVFAAGLVAARRKHVEDWAAIVVFNHLMAGVDALVGWHLWDVPVHLGARSTPNGPALTGRISW